MVGILEKLRALKPGTRLLSLLGALQDRLLTNLRPNEMRQLFDAQRQLRLSEIHRVTVDSTNFVDSTWFGRGGLFHSADMHVIERLTRKGDQILYQVTIEDPVLVEPWVMPANELD